MGKSRTSGLSKTGAGGLLSGDVQKINSNMNELNGVIMKQWNDRYYFNGNSRVKDDALGSKIYFDTKTNEVVVQSTQYKGSYGFGKQFSRYSLYELNKFENSAIGSYEEDKFKNISELVKRNFIKST